MPAESVVLSTVAQYLFAAGLAPNSPGTPAV